MRKPISKVSLLVALLGLVALLLTACGGTADKPTDNGNFVNQQPGSQSGGGFTVSPITPGSQQAAPNVQSSSEQVQSINSGGQAIRGIAYSPDGKLLATGSADKTLRLLDATTGQPANVKLPEAAEPVVGVAFHKDGKSLVVAQQKSVSVYDVASGKQTANWATTYEVRALGVGGDNKTVATAGLSDNVTLWDSTSGKETASLKGLGLYYGVAVSADGKFVAGASRTGSVDVFEVASSKRVKQLYGLGADVRSVAFSADGKTLAAGGSDGDILLFDTAKMEQSAALKNHTSAVMSLAFSADGKTLVSGSLDQNVLVWDVAAGKVNKTLTGHTQTIYAVAIAPAGDFVASAGGATENDVKTNSATATSAVVKLWKVK